MTKKSTVSALLAALLLTGALASCGSSDVTETPNTPDTTPTDTTAAVTETAEPELKPELPEKDFGGYEFHIINANKHDWMMIYTIDSEGENGDALNDAIFRRNTAVEEQFNVSIVEIIDVNAHKTAQRAVAAGDATYDLLLTYKANALDLVLQNYLVDFADIPYIDTTAPWWVQGSMDSMSIANRVFYGISLFDTTHYDGVRAIFFNKQMADTYDLENPYELVKSGKWTLDKMFELGNTVAQDLNGDGEWGENDQYGYCTWYSVGGQTLMTGTAANLSIHKDANDMPVHDMNSDYYIDRLTRVTEIINTNGFYNKFADKTNSGGVNHFQAGRSLFYNEAMGNGQKLRQMDIDFGILPAPKWDEAQDAYYNCGGNPYFMCVLTTNADIERTGIIMESLSFESMNTVKVAAYDEMLTGKVSRDNDSEEMLDIIYHSLVYDHPIALSVLSSKLIEDYMFDGKTDYASYFVQNESKIQKEIEKYVAAYESILNQ